MLNFDGEANADVKVEQAFRVTGLPGSSLTRNCILLLSCKVHDKRFITDVDIYTRIYKI